MLKGDPRSSFGTPPSTARMRPVEGTHTHTQKKKRQNPVVEKERNNVL